jgi:hypothetical protein
MIFHIDIVPMLVETRPFFYPLFSKQDWITSWGPPCPVSGLVETLRGAALCVWQPRGEGNAVASISAAIGRGRGDPQVTMGFNIKSVSFGWFGATQNLGITVRTSVLFLSKPFMWIYVSEPISWLHQWPFCFDLLFSCFSWVESSVQLPPFASRIQHP